MSNNQLKYVILIGLFAIPFVPLIVSASLFFPFVTGKAFVFRLIVEIIFACYLILAIRDKSYRPKFSWIFGALISFLIVMAAATIFAVNPFKAFWSNFERMEGYITLLHLGAYFIVLGSVLKTKELWNRLIATSLAGSVIMSGYCILQIFGKIAINQGGVRVDGPLGNAAYLGIYMVFHIFLAWILFIGTKSKWQRILLGAVALLDAVILYFTATRGAILGLLGGVVVALIYMVIKSEKGDNIRKVAAAGLLSLIVIVGLFFALKNVSFVQNSPVLSRFSSLSVSEIETQGRYYVWPMALKGFLDKPILGWGQEGFNFVFNKYYDPHMYNQEAWFDRAHSTPLDWLVAGGALGLLSYLSIFFALLYYIFKSEKENLSNKEKAVMLGLLSAYFFNNIFVFDQISSYILFFTVLAYMHFYTAETKFVVWDKISARLAKLFESEQFKPIIEAVILIFTIAVIYFVIYLPWQQNKDLMSVLQLNSQGKVATIADYTKPLAGYGIGFGESLEQISQTAINLAGSQSVTPEFKQQLFALVDKSFTKQLAVAPSDARYRLFYGMFLSKFGQYDKAIVQLQDAQELSPKKQQMYFEIITNLLADNKPADALVAAKTAYELDTTYEEARIIYGLTLLVTGNQSLSNEILSTVPERTLIFDDRYIAVLLSLKQFDQIIAIVEKRIELDPTNLQHRITLTAAYLQAGRRQEAIQTLQDLITLQPSFKTQGEYYISQIRAGVNP